LALLLLHHQQARVFSDETPPDWVSQWSASPPHTAQKATASPSARPELAVDQAAMTKRESQRWARIDQAVVELQRWLLDQLDRGLAVLDEQARAQWASMAARMVDAQAPGLGRRVLNAANGLQSGPHWPQRVLRELGLLQLLCDALVCRTDLPAALQSDLRMQIGWPLDKLRVQQFGQRLQDRWSVLGQRIEEGEGNLLERRVWLHGAASGCDALLLDYAHGTRSFPSAWVTGQSFAAELVFYPSAAPQRALLNSVSDALPAQWPQRSWRENSERLAQRIAALPWSGVVPWILTGARIVPMAQAVLVELDGRIVPTDLSDEVAAQLLAFGGGHPLNLFGEWDGRLFTPLSACSDEGWWQWSA
jgi:hypothetical protein